MVNPMANQHHDRQEGEAAQKANVEITAAPIGQRAETLMNAEYHHGEENEGNGGQNDARHEGKIG